MAKYTNTVAYQIQTKLDATGLNQLQQQLSSVSKSFSELAKKNSAYGQAQMKEDISRIQQVQAALSKSFNTNLNLVDLSAFKKEMGNLSLGGLQETMSKTAEGAKTFNSVLGTVGQIDTGFKNISSLSDKIMNTFGNTVRWGVTASIFQTIQNSLYRSVDYVKELDTSLNNIQIVTGETSANLTDWAKSANEAAAQLGASTVAFTDAAQLYAQNGYSEEDYTKLAALTTKVANVTQQSTSDVSEEITSLMAGYKMSIDEAEDSLSGMAVVAAESASDLGELAAAEQKVASAASTLGVSQDSLTAQLSTIISVTRAAPEQVGNSLKTIYARLGDLSLGKTLEDGVDLGEVSSTLEKVGVAVLDVNGDMRSMGDIIEDLMGKWQGLSQAQQQALAVKLAGKYQYNNLMTLMNNSDMYFQQKQMAGSSQGALDKQQAIYMDSMAAKIQTVQTRWEGLVQSVVDGDSLKPFLDGLADGLDVVTDISNTIGGMGPALTLVGSLMTKAFSQNIAAGFSNMMLNQERNNLLSQNEDSIISTMGGSNFNGVAASFLKNTVGTRSTLTGEQATDYNEKLQRYIEVDNQLIDAENKYSEVLRENQQVLTDNGLIIDDVTGKVKGFGAEEYEAGIKINKSIDETTSKMSEMQNLIYDITSGDELAGTEREFSRIAELSEKMASDSSFKEIKDDVNAFVESVQKGTISLEDAKKEAQELYEMLNIAMSEKADQKVDNSKVQGAVTETQLSAQDKRAKALAEQNAAENALADAQSIAYQQMTQQLLNVAGAIGQVAFAWQSFQGLGSLWADDDISTGEKFSRTLLTILTIMPQVISSGQTIVGAFDKVKSALDNAAKAETALKTAEAGMAAQSVATAGAEEVKKNAFLEAAKAKTESGTASAGLTIKEGVQTLATGAATVATKAFTVAIKALSAAMNTTPIGLIITGITTATALIPGLVSYFTSLNKEALENQAEKVKETKEAWDGLSSTYSNFDKAYNVFKETGEVTDDFVKSCNDAADALDLSGGKALIAAGNYDTFADSVKNAYDQQARESIDKIDANSAANNESLRGGFGNGSTKSDFDSKTNKAAGKLSDASLLGEDFSNLDYSSSDNVFENISTAESNIEKLQDKLKDLGTEEQAKQAGNLELWQQKTNAINGAIAAYQEYLDLDDVKTANENAQSKADIGVKRNDFQDALSGASSFQDIVDIFAGQNGQEDYGMADYFKSMSGDYEAQLQYMIQNITDANARAKVQLEQSKISLGQNLYGGYKDLADNGYISTPEGVSTEDAANEYAKQLTDQIDNSVLTDEEKVKFIASIDWNKSLPEIQKQIESLNNDPDSLEPLKIGAEVDKTNRLEGSSQSDVDDLLKSTGVSESSIDRSANSLLQDENGFYQQEADRIKSSIEEVNQSIEDGSKSAEDGQKEIKGLREQYDGLADDAKDVVVDNLRMNKGVTNLSKNFDDLASILTNDVKKGTAEYYDALDELDQDMSDILNIDPGTLSETFLTSADALDTMKRAADGDMSAIDDLRLMAADDIVTNFKIEGMDEAQEKVVKDQLIAAAADLQATLDGMTPEMQMSANLDDTSFVQQLNDLVANSSITAEQASEALSAMGIEGELSYKEGFTYTPVIEYNTQYGAIDKNTGLPSKMTISSQNVGYTLSSTKIPIFRGTHFRGKGANTAGILPSSGRKSGGGGRGGGGRGGGGGGRKGSGGGGGGSGKSYEPKTEKEKDSELNRYEKVNTHLGAIASSLSKIQDDQDRVSGQKYTENLAQQVDLLKEQVKWEEEKLKIEKEEAAEYRGKLSSEYGIQFNGEGYIENYKDTYNKLLNEYNDIVRQYNATTDEAGQNALKTQMENSEERLKNFSNYVDKYDTLISDTIIDSEQKIQGYYDKIEDLQIEAFNKRIESLSDVKDLIESRADFNTNLNRLLGGDYGDEDPYHDTLNALEKIKGYWNADSEAMQEYYDTLIAKQKEVLNSSTATEQEKKWAQSRLDTYNKYKAGHVGDLSSSTGDGLLSIAMKDLADVREQYKQFQETGKSDIFGENSAELLDTMKQAKENAEDIIESLKDSMSDLKDSILDMIDKIGDEIDDRLEQFDNINDKLESYSDIIQTIYGDESYDKINEVLAAQVQNNQNQIDNMRQSIEVLIKLRDSMKEGSDEWKAVNEKITEAQQNLIDKTSDTLDKLATIYQNKITKAINGWTANTALGGDLDWVSDEWELINRNADQYLDDVNAAYNIQKLQSKYMDLLDNSNQLAIQNKITNQMNQQLDYLREKDKLSQYDVDYANAQLEILQKTIALEDAQRNKSQMKLKRDNQGNYSYVYTADEDNIKSSESDLLDAKNNAYNLSKDQMKQVQDDAIGALQDAQNMISQIWSNANLDIEQKKERTEAIIDSLKTYLLGSSEQLSTAETNIINDFISMCESLTGENSAKLQETLEQLKNGNNEAFDAIDDRFTTSITLWLNNLDSFWKETDKVFGEDGSLLQAFKEYQANLEELEKKSKVPLSNMSAAIGDTKNEMEGLVNSTKQYINVLDDLSGKTATAEKALQEMNQKVQDSENSLRAFQGQYNDVSNKLVVSEREKSDLQGQYKQLQKEYEDYKAKKEAEAEAAANAASGGGGGGDWSPYDDAYAIWMYGAWGGGGYWYGPYAAANGSWKADQVLGLFNSGYGYTWMDTGGYTGDWGPGEGIKDAKNGKMAVLHSKELVLNASDTENILQAVEAVRQLTTNFRNGAFEDTVSAFNKYGSDLLKTTFDANQSVDQNVRIEASFPNVRGAEEIEQALLSLTNGAVQYAGRGGQY